LGNSKKERRKKEALNWFKKIEMITIHSQAKI
jgi:hypothetical protein